MNILENRHHIFIIDLISWKRKVLVELFEKYKDLKVSESQWLADGQTNSFFAEIELQSFKRPSSLYRVSKNLANVSYLKKWNEFLIFFSNLLVFDQNLIILRIKLLNRDQKLEKNTICFSVWVNIRLFCDHILFILNLLTCGFLFSRHLITIRRLFSNKKKWDRVNNFYENKLRILCTTL